MYDLLLKTAEVYKAIDVLNEENSLNVTQLNLLVSDSLNGIRKKINTTWGILDRIQTVAEQFNEHLTSQRRDA